MNYQTYYDRTQLMAKHVEEEAFAEALEILHALLESDISDIDKAIMCHNAAVVCEKMGLIDDMLGWYDTGIDYEAPYYRYMVQEYKAGWLASNGRQAEGLAIYESLVEQPYVMEVDRNRFLYNINVLRGGAA